MRLKLTWSSDDIMRPNDAHTFEVTYTNPKQCRTAISVMTRALSQVGLAAPGSEAEDIKFGWEQINQRLIQHKAAEPK